jgi:hypothetical protein
MSSRPYLSAARARSATSQVQRAVVTRLETARAKRRLGRPRKMIRRKAHGARPCPHAP